MTIRRRHKKRIEEDYTEWLSDKIGKRDGRTYSNLLILLNAKGYSDDIGNDRNRSYEGGKLREEYINENMDHWDDDAWERIDWCPCTFLEMMIALSYRLEELTYNPYEEGDTSASRWFWEMIENLGFSTYDDAWFENELEGWEYVDGIYYVNKTLETVNDRTCDYHNKGCLFPLQKSNRKVSQMELWDQANEYLIENYPIM